ncbi:MAG: hypothetical protein QNI99_11425 [Woeseiaceae bacterium]|nr:hypothetical protein [Woeseiaceae bacterium]
MPSSTSSSDVPYREVPEKNWGLAWVIAVVLVIAGVAAWEMQARAMHHVPGDYDELTNFAIQWGEERLELDDPDNDTRVVLLGSSRMLWGADLDILEEELGTRPLQMAIPGTGPALMFKSVVEESDFDGLVLIGVTPFLFNRLDAGMFGGEALRWYDGAGPSEYTGHWINSFLTQHFAFLDEGFRLFELLDNYSTLTIPEREGAYDLNARTWKLGHHWEDRQTDMWPPVEEEGSFDNEQILAFWMLGLSRPIPEPEGMQEMADSAVELFMPLVEQLRERGGDVVFIRMPSSGKYLEYDLAANYRELTWDPMAAGIDAVWINAMDYPELSSDLEIPEWSHLSRQSQDDFSRRIVPVMEQYYEIVRGQSIRDVIDAPDSED